MEVYNRTRVLSAIIKDIDNDKLSKNYMYQRKRGQWTYEQAVTLIDTLLQGYPINPLYIALDKPKSYIIDGIQRITTVEDFIKGDFCLPNNYPSLVINDMEYELAGLFFDGLPAELQDVILNRELHIFELQNYTTKELAQVFLRTNNGTAMTKNQKYIIYLNEDLLVHFICLADHEFWTKTAMSDRQFKYDKDRNVVLETIALISDYEIKNFSDEKLYKDLVPWLKEQDFDSIFERVTYLFDTANKFLVEKEKNLKKITIPYILYGLHKVDSEDRSIVDYFSWVNQFLENYEKENGYRKFVNTTNTGGKSNVLGRLEFFDKKIKKF